MSGCGFSRVSKDGEGGPGVGPLAPVDVWQGEDVHVDVAGRGRKRLPQGIAVPPSVHKADDCPPGEHRHDRFDYCHPEKRKHRGAPKQEAEKPDFVVEYNKSMKEKQQFQKDYRASFQLMADRERNGGDVDEAREIMDEAYEKYRDANHRVWELKRQVMQWRKEQRPEAAMLQRYNVLRALRFRAKNPYERRAIEDEMQEIERKNQALNIAKKEKRLPQEARRMLETVQDVIKFPLAVEHLTMGGREAASYKDATKTIAISPRVIKMLANYRKDERAGLLTPRDKERMAEFTSILLHEVLHSANPISMKHYMKGGAAERLEEGLTDWTAWYMGKRFISAILGQPFDWEEAVGTGPPEDKRPAHTKYGRFVRQVADYARTAGGGGVGDAGTKAAAYYITKWKFYTSPELRPRVMSEDLTRTYVLAKTGIKATPEQMYTHLRKTVTGIQNNITGGVPPNYNNIMKESFEEEKTGFIASSIPPKKEDDKELLPWQKRLRARAWEEGRWSEQWGERPEERPFQRAVRKVMHNLWRVAGFEFKASGYPTGGPAGGHGQNFDMRHTGSETPPRGVGWQKFPRQGGESVGGTGAGAVEAMEKHDTPKSRHCEHDPRADCAGFASGEEAGGRTQEEERARVMDWLERHEVPQDEEGRYRFYHATPKSALGSIRREGLKEGSLLETDPDSASHFAARDRDLKPSQIEVLSVAVLPHEIRVGMWAQLRVPHRLQ